jgi:NADH-quinone oxidoreductase subunit J
MRGCGAGDSVRQGEIGDSPLESPPFFLHQGRYFRPKSPFPPLSARRVTAGNPVPQTTVPDILFAIAAVAVVGLSLAVVLARNPVRSTLLLILSFLPVSLIYILMQASFAGILQVMVYAGAIMMLFTFVIMMINPAPGGGELPGDPADGAKRGSLGRSDVLWVLILCGIGLVLIPPVYYAAAQITGPMVASGGHPAHKEGFGTVESISQLIFKDPANNPLTVSFELISILILVGVIAAVNFGRRAHHKNTAATTSAAPTTMPEAPIGGGEA